MKSTERMHLFWLELEKQCYELNSDEFEYYFEVWGVLWMPWFIEVNKKTLTFSASDISSDDLKVLIEEGKIEIVKIYDKSEMEDEFDRKKYRLVKKPAIARGFKSNF